LSADKETARRVGMRYGKPVILIVDAANMNAEGYTFCRSDNGVWLTDHVPSAFISLEQDLSPVNIFIIVYFIFVCYFW
jgi:putative RNA 2'-phosphotransferase